MKNNEVITFLTDFFPDFPEHIIIRVLESLPQDYLLLVFMYFPSDDIRSATRNCFSNDLKFILGPQGTYKDIFKPKKHCHFYGLDCFIFMENYRDIIPKRLEIFFKDRNISWMKDFLHRYHNRISKVNELGFSLNGTKLLLADFNYLLSFTNLTTFIFTKMSLNRILFNNQKLSRHPNLKRLEFLDHKIYIWSKVKFPKNLKHLIMSKTSVSGISVHETIETFSVDVNSLNNPLRIPRELTSLTLVDSHMHTLVIDDLPDSLQKLLLYGARVESIRGNNWPSNLVEIKLVNNSLDDNLFSSINNGVGWPVGLTHLDIGTNRFTQTNNLTKLPQSLKSLTMSNNRCEWDYTIPFRFPSNLIELDMRFTRLQDLKYFEFPSSLQKLDLSQNNINNILSYEHWGRLVNLTKLHISSNNIRSLNDWVIPPNLISLKLDKNPISKISQSFPLFNSVYNFNLVDLDFSECQINNLQIDYIPVSLKILNISNNNIGPSFVVPECFKQLSVLDLSHNQITEMVFQNPDHKKTQNYTLHRKRIKQSYLTG